MLTDLLAYLQVDDEVQVQRLMVALYRVFGSGKRQAVEPEEEVIDTTDPDFVNKFVGFVGAPGQK